ncbi:unnamed protein product, partial [Cyprideis torosa]
MARSEYKSRFENLSNEATTSKDRTTLSNEAKDKTVATSNDVADNWMDRPLAGTNVPPGLEYLRDMDKLLVVQMVELIEVATSNDVADNWMDRPLAGTNVPPGLEYLRDMDKLIVVQMVELVEDCKEKSTRYLFKENFVISSLRPFTIRILDNRMHDVMMLDRPLACDSCCFPCCLQ